jgi:hypothetical protein
MRRLLTSLRDWLYLHSPARIPTLMEQSIPVWKFGLLEARLAELESGQAATVAVLDRIEAPRRLLGPILLELADLTDAESIALIRQAIANLKAEGKL